MTEKSDKHCFYRQPGWRIYGGLKAACRFLYTEAITGATLEKGDCHPVLITFHNRGVTEDLPLRVKSFRSFAYGKTPRLMRQGWSAGGRDGQSLCMPFMVWKCAPFFCIFVQEKVNAVALILQIGFRRFPEFKITHPSASPRFFPKR